MPALTPGAILYASSLDVSKNTLRQIAKDAANSLQALTNHNQELREQNEKLQEELARVSYRLIEESTFELHPEDANIQRGEE